MTIRNLPYLVGNAASATRATSFSLRRRWAISSSMEMISRLCRSAMSSNRSRLARSPFSSKISQRTPAGVSPAIRARSTAASVWPARREHTALLGQQQMDVPGADEILRAGLRVDDGAHGHRSFLGGDPRADGRMIQRSHESSGAKGAVLASTKGQTSSRLQMSGSTGTQNSTPTTHHEIDDFGRRLLGSGR